MCGVWGQEWGGRRAGARSCSSALHRSHECLVCRVQGSLPPFLSLLNYTSISLLLSLPLSVSVSVYLSPALSPSRSLSMSISLPRSQGQGREPIATSALTHTLSPSLPPIRFLSLSVSLSLCFESSGVHWRGVDARDEG